MSPCPCGSNLEYDACCGPILRGEQPAPTAEALMRARYSAFVNVDVDFLSQSLHPDHREDHDANATRRWAESADWRGLEIVATAAGGDGDDEGEVEFIASYKEKGILQRYHERSRFRRHDGRWYFVDGELVLPRTEVHKTPKVGRNDSCPCGSGKKFKKCCGR
jgi:SEC-C motif-containing protein